jgi:hypothetical protein
MPTASSAFSAATIHDPVALTLALSDEKIETKNVMGVSEPRRLGQLAFFGAKAYLPFCPLSKRKFFFRN